MPADLLLGRGPSQRNSAGAAANHGLPVSAEPPLAAALWRQPVGEPAGLVAGRRLARWVTLDSGTRWAVARVVRVEVGVQALGEVGHGVGEPGVEGGVLGGWSWMGPDPSRAPRWARPLASRSR